ncbi:DUF3152 domain-containing protein [Streptomyces avicenniae]|uniref:DUF3152 domain-containing protein n=1 Tax=Streptomyces avicenniae TaxID=500153 RepID=UPI000A5D2214|nr:DUF3152 domain-containing protein [Streptomyces avicenniae]
MDHRETAAPSADAETGPGPRQEYLDAFEEDTFGRPQPIPRQRAAERKSPSPGGRHRLPPQHGRRRVPGDSGGRRAGGRGRTLTGVAAAAVVTVLTVAVAVQVAGGEDDRSALVRGTGGDERAPAASGPADGGPETHDGPSGQEPEALSSPSAETLPDGEQTYDRMMMTMFAMDPELTGSGELVPVPGTDPADDPDATTVLRYRVDVEAGLGLDPEFFAEVVHRTLNDPRSWGNGGERSFARVSGGDHDFVVTLASPGTAADWCARSGLDITEDNVSCNSSNTERVIINAWRWAQGSETYFGDIAAYRQMLVNHEVGHRLGYGHALCPADGALAPVMMQQTKFLDTDGLTCLPNPWPHPDN